MERMGLTRVVWNRPIDGHQGFLAKATRGKINNA